MGFWIFMLIMDLLIPFTMIGFGKVFLNNAPKKINWGYGYRTSMSMKNQDTWTFAHKYCGRLWHLCGWILLPVSVIAMLLALGKSEDMIGLAGGVLVAIQLIPLVGVAVPTEIALRKTFDTDGNRRNLKNSKE